MTSLRKSLFCIVVANVIILNIIYLIHRYGNSLKETSFSHGTTPPAIWLQTATAAIHSTKMATPAAGSTRRIMVVSYWRSGSTFLGALIQSAPGTFYTYEPLHFLDMHSRMESLEQIEKAIELIKSLFQCTFPPKYFNYTTSRAWGRPYSFFMTANSHALEYCKSNESLCEDPQMFASVCNRFGAHLMKTVRLPLSAVRRLIDESASNEFKIVYLVRDPHGIMASRIGRDWCTHSSCQSASQLCLQMHGDLNTFDEYRQLYPNTFYQIKFEDLTGDVDSQTTELFKFLGLTVTSEVKEFLSTHTNSTDEKENKNPFSIVRYSKTVASAWHEMLNDSVISSIDDSCSKVLRALNYEHASLD